MSKGVVEQVTKWGGFFLLLVAIAATVIGWIQWQDLRYAFSTEVEDLRAENIRRECLNEVSRKRTRLAGLRDERNDLEKVLKLNASAAYHYRELKRDNELRNAEIGRLDHLNEIVPQQQSEIETIQQQILQLESELSSVSDSSCK